jgi:hypothetical protein
MPRGSGIGYPLSARLFVDRITRLAARAAVPAVRSLDVLVHVLGPDDDDGPDDRVDDQSDDDFHVRPLPWGLRRPSAAAAN